MAPGVSQEPATRNENPNQAADQPCEFCSRVLIQQLTLRIRRGNLPVLMR